MANLIFPPAPTTGQEFIGTFGEIYTWDGEKWTLTSAGPVVPTPPPVAIGSTPPASPASGDLWWDTISGQLFIWYIDANSAQWVVANVSVGVPGPAGPAGPNTLPMGVTDGSDATPGQIGEYISSVVDYISLPPSAWTTVTTIALTPGDWNVWGEIWGGSGSSGQAFYGVINSASGAPPTTPTAGHGQASIGVTSGTGNLTGGQLAIAPVRLLTNIATTMYLVSYQIGVASGYSVAGRICARRMR